MIIGWINRRYHTHLNEANLAEVKNFALVWNIFEGRVCNYSFRISEIEQKLQNLAINIVDFLPYIAYFKDRYTHNNSMENCFDGLNFRNGDRRSFVEGVLLGENILAKDYLLAITIIVYRLRNNLFHGLKEMHSINGQRDNFDNANQFLMKLIDLLDPQ